MRPDEDVVGQGDSSVKGGEVLNLAVVAYNDINVDVHVLPDVAASADASPLTDLDPMPDPSPVADYGCGRDLRGWMNPRGHGPPQPRFRHKYVSGLEKAVLALCAIWSVLRRQGR